MHVLRVVVFLFGSCVGSLGAQESVLARVPQAFPNVVHVLDVLPHVERLFESPRFAETWALAMAEVREGDAAVVGSLPEQLRGLLGLARDSVPEEMVVAWSPATSASFGAVLEATVRLGTGWFVGARGIDDPTLATYRADAVAALRDVAAPSAVLAIRMRDERTAELQFEQLVTTVTAAFPDAEIGTESDTIDVPAAVMLALLADPLIDRVAALGIFAADSAESEAVRAALAKLVADLRIERDGDVLMARIGKVEGPYRDPAAPLCATGPAAGAVVLQTAWELERFRDRAASAYDVLMSLGEDATDAMFEVDPERMSGLYENVEFLAMMPASGATRVAVAATSVEVDLRELLEWIPPTLATTAIGRVLPQDAGIVARSSFWTFDEAAFLLYDGLIGELEGVAQAAAAFDRPELATVAEHAATSLMWQFEGVWDLLAGEESAVFEEGVVAVFDGDSGPHLAIAGLTKLAGTGQVLFARLVDEVARGMELEVPENGFLTDVELEPGLTAKVARLPGVPGIDAPDAARRCIPHVVEVDGLFVVSTNPELTRAVVAAHRSGDAPAPDDDLVGETRASGAAVATYVRSLADRLATADERTGVTGLLRAAAVLWDAVREVRLEERLAGEELHSKWTVTVRD